MNGDVDRRGRDKPFQRRATLARLRRDLDNYHAAERKVAQFFLQNPSSVVTLSVTQVADQAQVSEATVIRLCKSLGFTGFAQFKIHLASEIAKPFSFVPADISEQDGPIEIMEKVFRAEMQSLYETLAAVDPQEFLAAVDAVATARSLCFFGLGTSGPIALDAAYRFEQLGIPSTPVIDAIQMSVSALNLDDRVVAIGISNSGATRATYEALELARSAGARTICITSYQRSPIVSVSDISLVAAAQEMHYRFEAMASRLAHISILDALSVAIAHLDPKLREAHLRRSAEVIARHRF